MKPEDKNGCPETDANLDEQLQRWQVANILRQEFPRLDASTIASVIWEAFSDGRDLLSWRAIQRCFEILEQREKEAK